MNKTSIRTILIILTLIIAISCFVLFSICTNNYHKEEIKKISVFNSLTGENLEITDENTVHNIIEHLNHFTPALGIRIVPTGSHFTIHLYDASGKAIDSITIIDNAHIAIDNTTYWVNCQDIITFLSGMEMQN